MKKIALLLTLLAPLARAESGPIVRSVQELRLCSSVSETLSSTRSWGKPVVLGNDDGSYSFVWERGPYIVRLEVEARGSRYRSTRVGIAVADGDHRADKPRFYPVVRTDTTCWAEGE